METATLEVKADKNGSLPDSDKDSLQRLLYLDQRVYNEGYVPSLDEIPILNNPERYLTEQHLALLKYEGRTDRDIKVIATIESMSPLLMKTLDINYSHRPEFLKDYVRSQISWINTAYRLQANGRPISELTLDEKFNAYFAKGTPRKYKLFFCLENKDKVMRLEEPDPVLSMSIWDAKGKN